MRINCPNCGPVTVSSFTISASSGYRTGTCPSCGCNVRRQKARPASPQIARPKANSRKASRGIIGRLVSLFKRTPKYEGRTIDEWVQLTETDDGDGDGEKRVSEVIRRFGAEAVPRFVRLYEERPLQSSPNDMYTQRALTVLGMSKETTRYDELVEILGIPEKVEITKEEVFETLLSKIPLGGNKVLKYPSRGMRMVIAKKNRDVPNPPIDSITCLLPFNGVVSNGLSLGMSREEATLICLRDFHVGWEDSSGSSVIFHDKRGETAIQLWFQDDKLTQIGGL